MVILDWIDKLVSPNKDIPIEIQKSKDSINRLVELTEQLDVMENSARRNSEFLGALTNSLDISIWVKDLECRFTYLNDACARDILGGVTVDEALHFTDADFDSDILAHKCMESDRKVQESLTTRRFIEHARYPNRDLWLDVVKSPLFVKEKLIGVVGSAKDITDHVSKKLKDSFNEPASVEIDLEGEYCTEQNGGKRKSDLKALLEKDSVKEVI